MPQPVIKLLENFLPAAVVLPTPSTITPFAKTSVTKKCQNGLHAVAKAKLLVSDNSKRGC